MQFFESEHAWAEDYTQKNHSCNNKTQEYFVLLHMDRIGPDLNNRMPVCHAVHSCTTRHIVRNQSATIGLVLALLSEHIGHFTLRVAESM